LTYLAFRFSHYTMLLIRHFRLLMDIGRPQLAFYSHWPDSRYWRWPIMIFIANIFIDCLIHFRHLLMPPLMPLLILPHDASHFAIATRGFVTFWPPLAVIAGHATADE